MKNSSSWLRHYGAAATATRTGQHRGHNEDYAIAISQMAMAPHLGLFIVADGIGGLSKGEVAARRACEVVVEEIGEQARTSNPPDGNWGSILAKTMDRANRAVRELSAEHGSMGNALVVALRDSITRSVFISQCGDCRAYQFRPYRGLSRLTYDDNYRERFAAQKPPTCSPREEMHLLHWIGAERIAPDVVWLRLEPEERPNIMLLTSDGVHGGYSIETAQRRLRKLCRNFTVAVRKERDPTSMLNLFLTNSICTDDATMVAFVL